VAIRTLFNCAHDIPIFTIKEGGTHSLHNLFYVFVIETLLELSIFKLGWLNCVL